MKFIIDTQILLWAAQTPDRLPNDARAIIEDVENDVIFSVASIWEVAIKCSLGRADFRTDPHLLRIGLLEAGYEELVISGPHAAAVGRLPPIHRDPFDRLLIAQGIVEAITLITVDQLLARYPGPVRLLGR